MVTGSPSSRAISRSQDEAFVTHIEVEAVRRQAVSDTGRHSVCEDDGAERKIVHGPTVHRLDGGACRKSWAWLYLEKARAVRNPGQKTAS